MPSVGATRETSRPTQPASLDWTTRLLQVDTTSRESNLPLIDLVADELRAHGVEPVLVANEDGSKANLLATFPAADGTTTGGVVLSGHTDVVPVDGQDWSSEPFVPEVRDGRLYGRGTCDMKAFIGSVMTAVPRLSRTSLSEPVHLAFSYDEEVGCVGAVSLVDEIVERGLRPAPASWASRRACASSVGTSP